MVIDNVSAGQAVNPDWGNAVADQLNGLALVQSGLDSVVLDASGNGSITFPEEFGAVPVVPMPAARGSVTYVVFVTGVTTTGISVNVRRNDSGAIFASTTLSVGWVAVGPRAVNP